MSSDQELSVLQPEDSEDDFDWEEVEVPDQVQEPRHFDITISAPKSAASENKCVGSPRVALTYSLKSGRRGFLMLNDCFAWTATKSIPLR
jgi:hypothetical protein